MSTTITGVAGTTIAGVCTGPQAGKPVLAGDVNAPLLSIENDIATIGFGNCTIAGNKTLTGITTCTGVLVANSTATFNGAVSCTSTVSISGSLTLTNASNATMQTECTFGNSPAVKVISNATNATPIVVTTTTAHGYLTGDQVTVETVLGNTAANGTWVVKFLSSTTFSLVGSAGSGAYTSGGDVYRLPMPAFSSARSATRALGSSFNDGYVTVGGVRGWTVDSGGEAASFNAAPTTTTQHFGYNITPAECPQGASLLTATIYMQPQGGAAHGAVPATPPQVDVFKIKLSNNASTTLGTTVDPNTGSVGAYEVYTPIVVTLGTAETIDHSRYTYRVVLSTESGANALEGTHVMHGEVTFSARHDEQI